MYITLQLKTMYPAVDDVCKKMTEFIHRGIKKEHPNEFDAKDVRNDLVAEKDRLTNEMSTFS